MGSSTSTITTSIGCVPISDSPVGLSGSYATPQTCYSYCANSGYTYGIAQPINSGTVVACGCTNTIASPSDLEAAQVSYLLGSTVGCGDAAYGLQTSFLNTAPVCYSVPGYVTSAMTVYPDPSQCFVDCRYSPAMWLIPVYNQNTGENDWRCSCATGPPPGGTVSVCNQNQLLYMTHTKTEASLGVARRKKRAAELRKWAQSQLCAPGQTACRLGDTDYECLDVDNELESCGGCMNGPYQQIWGPNTTVTQGVNCEDVPGVAIGGSTCQQGKCVAYSCRPGYTLKDGTCVPRRNRKRATTTSSSKRARTTGS